MKYNQPYGVSDVNAPYINGNPSTGTMGSIPPAASIEYPQREIVNIISDCGITPDNADLHQVAKAVQSGMVLYGVDTGVKNQVTVNLTPTPSKYHDGMFVWVTPIVTNDGPSTVNVNALGARNIVRRGGAALSAGDLIGGYRSLLCYSALHANFELYGIDFGTPGGFLPILTANTNLYVNGTTGDDTIYDGTTPTVAAPHGPFKTIGRAVNETWKYGPSLYTMTINIAAGTYTENVQTPNIVGPTTIFKGAGITQTFVQCPSGGGYTFLSQASNRIIIQDLHAAAVSTVEGSSIFVSTTGAKLETANTATGGAPHGYIFDALGGYLYAGNNNFDSGTVCYAVFTSFTGGNLVLLNSVYTHMGALTCNVYATAVGLAVISTNPPGAGDPSFSSPGFVTGSKWSTDLNGTINTQGHSVSYFPGTAAGASSRGGQYG